MAEFASKGVAGAGLGTGIAGLALGVLNSSNNGNGLLGGLFGGGNQNVVSALQAENGMLKAENYSDKNAKEVYAQSLADNRRLRDETFAYLKPLADESANNRVELAKLQAELKCCCEKQELREQIVLGKVNELVSCLLLMVRSRVMSLSLEPSTWMNLLLQRQEPLRYTLM